MREKLERRWERVRGKERDRERERGGEGREWQTGLIYCTHCTRGACEGALCVLLSCSARLPGGSEERGILQWKELLNEGKCPLVPKGFIWSCLVNQPCVNSVTTNSSICLSDQWLTLWLILLIVTDRRPVLSGPGVNIIFRIFFHYYSIGYTVRQRVP